MRGQLSVWRFMSRIPAVVAALTFIIAVLVVPEAHAWWDGKWQQRMQVDLDASTEGADIGENLADIPVLIRLHTGNFSFPDANEDGSDLRFLAADDKTPLKYHIEKFDPSEEIALVWVKAPNITGGDKKDYVWMYYGNSSAASGQDSGGTYDVNHIAVFHFGEEEGSPKDSTAYGNHASAFSGDIVSSVAGYGASFGAAGGQMTVPAPASLDFSKGFTFSAWVRPGQATGNSQLFSWADAKQSIVVGIDDAKPYLSLISGQTMTTPKTAALTPGQWHHLAVAVAPGERVTVYIDGTEAASNKFIGTVPAPAGDMTIAGAFRGDIDEVQLSNTARGASWIKQAYESQGSEGSLVSYMEAESGGGGEESLTIHLMKVIAKTITLDGWLIIGILLVMGILAAFVFKQKFTMLREARKTNESFSESFKRIDDPMELFEKKSDFQGSSFYGVYRSGCEELKAWLNRKGETLLKGDGLSDRAMNGFRAAVEKEAMYQSRRLSAGMFIMNMCVAGGPFLGLLGTVWGVMNTFASLAESGEANLSAIAPGVASALACTMAGLVVAIPALFASSFLTGQMKDMNADLNVFIDDFILKLEEVKTDAP
ncbi:MAG: hypothetical protein A2052_04050 [Deltaproteobacteria bacterium GWA2_54_12]|nr:MAG: hypothetical protein A2052_04050 [Deltaproteobacteria bacterium GWA2_54_12]